MKLKLNDFDKIIFDMDGVVTSELAYWQTAALGAYDMLLSHEHYGVCGIDREWCRRKYLEIYNTIMCGGRTVKAVKRLGVNTNWDLLYIVFCVSKYINPELSSLDSSHFQSVCMFIENIDLKAPELYDALAEITAQALGKDESFFKRSGDFFKKDIFNVFDLWYNGCDEFEGIKTGEELLFPDDELKKTFKHLNEIGIRLGIGTGRPRAEIEYPLTRHGLLNYFDPKLFASYDEVFKAENELKPQSPLAKPDPYVFLKAAIGEKYSDREIYDKKFNSDEISRTLVVGDAPSDLMSAKGGGFKFLGVLTGIEGDGMQLYFKENHADYILNNVLEIK